MGTLNNVNIQPAYWRVKGSYIPVAAMLLTKKTFYQVLETWEEEGGLTFSDVFPSQFIQEPTVHTAKHHLHKQFY